MPDNHAAPTFASLYAACLHGRSVDRAIFLRFADCVIKVASDSDRLISCLSRYYHEFLTCPDASQDITVTAIESQPLELDLPLVPKMPDPGKNKIKEELYDFPDGRVVRKRLTGMVFLFGADEHLAVGPCLQNDNQVVNFINNRFIQHKLRSGCLLAHAAGISRQGQGVAMAGFSGMGKSTLALTAMNLDCTFISNDRLMLRREDGQPRMYGVPKLPRVNPGTILSNPCLRGMLRPSEVQRLRTLPPDELWNLEQKYDVHISDCYGPGRFQLEADVRALALLNWKRDGGPLRISRVDPAERQDLLRAFMKSPGVFYDEDENGLTETFSESAYVRLLEETPVYELSGGVDFRTAAEFCLDLIDKAVRPA